MQMIFLKNRRGTGICPLTIPLDKIQLFKVETKANGAAAVSVYFANDDFAHLAYFDTKTEAVEALDKLEAEIAHTVTKIKPYSVQFIEASSWVGPVQDPDEVIDA